MALPNHHLPSRDNDRASGRPLEPVYCIVGETLCLVRIWTEEEWALLAPEQRAGRVAHVPGLGWVGAVPPGRAR